MARKGGFSRLLSAPLKAPSGAIRPAAVRRPAAALESRAGARRGPVREAEPHAPERDAEAAPVAVAPAPVRPLAPAPGTPYPPPRSVRLVLEKPLRPAVFDPPTKRGANRGTNRILARLEERPLAPAPALRPEPRTPGPARKGEPPAPPAEGRRSGPSREAPSAGATPPAPESPTPRAPRRLRTEPPRRPEPAEERPLRERPLGERPLDAQTMEERPARSVTRVRPRGRTTADASGQGAVPPQPVVRKVFAAKAPEKEETPAALRREAKDVEPAEKTPQALRSAPPETPSLRPRTGLPRRAARAEPSILRPPSEAPVQNADAAPGRLRAAASAQLATAAPRTPSPPPPVTIRVGQVEIRAPQKKAAAKPTPPPRAARAHRINPGISFASGRW